MSFLLSLIIPRKVLQMALLNQWKKTLSRGDRIRLEYWGATGNDKHHPFAWADDV